MKFVVGDEVGSWGGKLDEEAVQKLQLIITYNMINKLALLYLMYEIDELIRVLTKG